MSEILDYASRVGDSGSLKLGTFSCLPQLYQSRLKEQVEYLVRQDWDPAVVHVDGTARAQILTRQMNPLLYDVIALFYERTGIPMLINTSFNLKGEPIVDNPIKAISTFFRSKCDVLYIGNFKIVNDS